MTSGWTVNPLKSTSTTRERDMQACAVGLSLIVAEKMENTESFRLCVSVQKRSYKSSVQERHA